MNFYIFEQLPVLKPEVYNQELIQRICKRVIELVYTSHNLRPFAEDCGYDRDPFPWNPERREELIAELDGIFAHLYRINREDYEYILGTFPIYFPDPDDYQLHLQKYDEMKSLVEESR